MLYTAAVVTSFILKLLPLKKSNSIIQKSQVLREEIRSSGSS